MTFAVAVLSRHGRNTTGGVGLTPSETAPWSVNHASSSQALELLLTLLSQDCLLFRLQAPLLQKLLKKLLLFL